MSLEIYIGPMYAGKTTKMMEMYYKNNCPLKIVVDYCDHEHGVSMSSLNNHNNTTLHGVYKVKTLLSLCESHDASIAQHVYINECQFFPDLYEYVIQCLKRDVCVYLYGLDGDFKQELFGQTMSLIPYCSHIEKIQGTCNTCSNSSILSYRTCENKEVYLPNSDVYIPLCLKCHKEIQ